MRKLRPQLALFRRARRTFQKLQTDPIELCLMHPPMVFAAVLTTLQDTDERHPFTAMLAIHGGKECIWGAKLTEAHRKENRSDSMRRRVGLQDSLSPADESRDKVAVSMRALTPS